MARGRIAKKIRKGHMKFISRIAHAFEMKIYQLLNYEELAPEAKLIAAIVARGFRDMDIPFLKDKNMLRGWLFMIANPDTIKVVEELADRFLHIYTHQDEQERLKKIYQEAA